MRILLLLSFLFFIPCSAQKLEKDSITISEPITTPEIVIKAPLGKLIDLGEVSLKLKEVVSDSRCPSNVHCIWAGEITVKVNVYKNGKYLKEQTLRFSSANNSITDIYSTESYAVTAVSVTPYPEAQEKQIRSEDYILHVKQREN